VIAADEGIMPQSREHLHICNLLRIKSGLVAITKADLVEPDWLELVSDEVGEFVKGTFLEGTEIVPVSSKTGLNLDILKEKIKAVALKIEPKPEKGLFRLPVDRVFTMKGFGTVVTGTAVSGSVSVEEAVEILPFGKSPKVRGLHSHGRAVKKVLAGQRTAVNLQGIEKEDLKRGDTLVSPGRFTPTYSLDVNVQLLPQSPVLKSRSLVHFHLGTAETVARVILYGAEQLEPGSGCYGQLRLKNPVIAQAGDRYIIRRFSPLETIGGGEVLDPSPSRRKKRDGTDDLMTFEKGTLEDKIAVKVGKASLAGMARAAVEGWIGAEVPVVRDAVGALKSQKMLIKLDETLFHRDAFDSFRQGVVRRLEESHRKNPLKDGVQKEEIRARMRVEQKVFSSLIASVEEVVSEKSLLRLKGFRTALSGEDKSSVLKMLEDKGFNPPTKAELAGKLSMSERQVGDVLKLMHNEGAVTRINDDISLSGKAYDKMIGLLREHFGKKADMTVAEFRDMLGTTRKYALPYLEYLDSNSVTLRVGDVRKLLLKAEAK
jgi:selenocysteine-specific elongation factor